MLFDIAASVMDQYLYEVTNGQDLWLPVANPFEVVEHVSDDDLEFLLVRVVLREWIRDYIVHMGRSAMRSLTG